MRRTFLVFVTLILLSSMLLVGCAPAEPTRDEALVVGSVVFSELELISEIVIQALSAGGVPVVDGGHTGNTSYTRQRLIDGEIDMFIIKNSIGWATFLEQGPVYDIPLDELHNLVREKDAENDVVWLEMSNVRFGHGLSMLAERAQMLQISTISDLTARLEVEELTLASTEGFRQRPDTLPGLTAVYGIDFRGNYYTVTGDETVNAIINEHADVAVTMTSDWRILYYGLVLLEDDKDFFFYGAYAPLIRAEAFERFPQVADILSPVMERLTADIMMQLTFRFDGEGIPKEQVAREWLESEGFI